jgi:hypothetical protein
MPIQLCFHQFYEPLTPEQQRPTPAGPFKIMSCPIKAGPWRGWIEIVPVIAAFVATSIGRRIMMHRNIFGLKAFDDARTFGSGEH